MSSVFSILPVLVIYITYIIWGHKYVYIVMENDILPYMLVAES